ncbi:tonoplast intrinsic protein 1 [Prunus dulcis]|uniref:Very-long-chain (3R)-3-hydroxyacyl-CoA dehydratase n=1 Tax=Prunus dulcis TaxID=3755 RepID=A0A4Y1RLT1_PRUDU|nr:tonoplast intrinsic protein 1 [Prunus dulcis]
MRYTAFIVLYPPGMAGETWLMYQALPFVKKTSLFPDLFAGLSYYNFLRVLLVCYPFLCLKLYLHMFKQRRSKLGKHPKKKKSKPLVSSSSVVLLSSTLSRSIYRTTSSVSKLPLESPGLQVRVVCGGELLMCVWGDVDEIVDKGSNGSADEWAEPVDPVVVPCPADDSGSEGDCWVHGCTIKGTSNQDVGTNNETNCNGGNDAYVALLWVKGCGINCVVIESFSLNELVAYQSTGCKPEKQACNHGSKQLGNPVQNRPDERDVAANKGTKCDSRVNMTAGDVCCNGNRHEKCKGMGQGSGYKASRCR